MQNKVKVDKKSFVLFVKKNFQNKYKNWLKN